MWGNQVHCSLSVQHVNLRKPKGHGFAVCSLCHLSSNALVQTFLRLGSPIGEDTHGRLRLEPGLVGITVVLAILRARAVVINLLSVTLVALIFDAFLLAADVVVVGVSGRLPILPTSSLLARACLPEDKSSHSLALNLD